MKKLTDPDFRYVPSVSTDIRKTFARVRREQAAKAKEEAEKKSAVVISKASKFKVPEGK